MATAFNTRKRIRRFFGHIESVAPMPNLIEVQKSSYEGFLQRAIPAAKRMIVWRGESCASSELQSRLYRMASVPARYYCVLPRADKASDGLQPLLLLKSLQRTDVVAYCDGPAGLWSQLLSPSLGSPLIFGNLHEAAPYAGEGDNGAAAGDFAKFHDRLDEIAARLDRLAQRAQAPASGAMDRDVPPREPMSQAGYSVSPPDQRWDGVERRRPTRPAPAPSFSLDDAIAEIAARQQALDNEAAGPAAAASWRTRRREPAARHRRDLLPDLRPRRDPACALSGDEGLQLRRDQDMLSERHDLLLFSNRQPAGARLRAAAALSRRHPFALHRGVQHLGAEPQQPLDVRFSAWCRLPPKASGRKGLGREVVGQRRVPNHTQEDRDERREPK